MNRIYVILIYFLINSTGLPAISAAVTPPFFLSNNQGKDFLQVLPNPGNGIFTLVFKSDFKGQIMIAVSDATGKYVYLKTIRDFGGEQKEVIDLSGNPKGIYIFEVETDNNRESKKIILQ